MDHEFTAEERFAIIWAQHQQDMAAGAFKKYERGRGKVEPRKQNVKPSRSYKPYAKSLSGERYG